MSILSAIRITIEDKLMHSRRCALLFFVVLPTFGATSISSIEATQMQAKITVQTDQPGFCTYRASRGTAFNTNIPDLLDNTNTDARAGSIVNAGTHVFILGTRKANYALAAAATYWIGVTCGADSEVSTVFPTRSIQWGNTAPDIVPFNRANFGNMDHPRIDWNGTAAPNTFCDPSTHSYCDPNTGVEYWLATHPGWAKISGTQEAALNSTVMMTPIDMSGTGKWSSPANAKSNGTSFSVASSGSTDKLFIPLANFNNPGGGGPLSGWGNATTIDDISYDVYCGSASAPTTPLNLQLSIDGGQTGVGNVITTSNCGSAAPVKLGTYPNAGDPTKIVAQPIFKAWGYTPQRNLLQPPSGTVSVAGTAVTLTTSSPTWANWFIHDWPAGSTISINGSYVHLAASPSTATTLTIQENLGTLTNVAYSGANFGVIVTKANSSSANVSVSLGINYSTSELPTACCNGDIGMLNLASVSVNKSADGTTCGIYTIGCSAGVLNPPLSGYIGYLASGTLNYALVLWIPFNSDKSPRAETRFLSSGTKPSGSARVNGNGDSLSGTQNVNGFFFDNADGASVYGSDTSNRIWKLTYNVAYPGCAGYVSYHPFPASGDYGNGLTGGPLADDCFTWTILTPLSTTPPRDVRSQIISGYQTGLNYLGQTVGPAHPGFDLGWMPNIRTSPGADGGLFSVGIDYNQDRLGVLGSFDVSTGALKHVRDFWSDPNIRWSGIHTCPVFNMGTYRFCVADPLEDTGSSTILFPNRNRATVSQVNRAGFGSTAAWDSNTALTSNTDYRTCPTAPAPYGAFSGTSNCVQIRINTLFCQVTPNSSYVFPDGKTEKDEFPCSTPGFGVANAAFSKLQDIAAGDWITSSDGTEYFVVLTSPVYNSATDITFWVLRTAGYLYTFPTYGGGDDTNGQGHAAGLSCCTHANGWYAWAIPFAKGQGAAIDVSNPSNAWLRDNPMRLTGHGSAGRGSVPGTYNFAQGGSGCWFSNSQPANSTFCGNTNLTPAQHVNAVFVKQASQDPMFSGISAPVSNAGLQTYNSSTQAASVSPFPFYVDFRHINPASGGGSELNSSFGNSFTSTLVSGTTKTYRVSADCCVTSPDYKRWGLQAYAGRFWLKDISSPAIFGSAADMADWSVCKARNSNECVFGSTAGQYYVTLPKHDIQSQCVSNLFDLATPCVSSFGPWSGQTVQFRVDKLEPTGLTTRKFGFAHGHPGLAYQFSNCRVDPSGQFMFCPGYWLDGVRTEWLALRIGALPPSDTVNRTAFVPVSLTYQGVSFAANIRARFGYGENGGDLLRCTAYGQDCSTEIPSGSPSDPFSFTNEAVARQACANGTNCTITIPSLPNRILYYIVDRLDSSGNVLETSPMQAVAVP